MKLIIRSVGGILLFSALTMLTQVGGLVYLLHLALMRLLGIRKRVVRWPAFFALYLFISLVVVPPLARLNNRVPLPVTGYGESVIRPRNLFISLANRNYVRPELKDMLASVADQMAYEYPGLKIEYLDANFPLLEEFRMYPHIRHDDGRKLDLAYIRKGPAGDYVYRYISLFGYGYSVKPLPGETDKPARCAAEGAWQYNIIERYVPDQDRKGHTFAVEENRRLLELIAGHRAVRYVIIEPHLQERTGLQSVENIRSLGCWAIRHDDHIHIAGHR